MAGGPTVNAADQVVGVNSGASGSEDSYVTNTPELRSFLQVRNVDLVEAAAAEGSSRWRVVGVIALGLATVAGVAALLVAFIRHAKFE